MLSIKTIVITEINIYNMIVYLLSNIFFLKEFNIGFENITITKQNFVPYVYIVIYI